MNARSSYSTPTATKRAINDAAITVGEKTLTSPTAAFTSADVGRSVAVAGAGPDGGVANGGGDSVTIVDTGTNAVTATISVGDGPSGVAFRHDSTRAYVANVNADSVSVLDTGAPAVVATVPKPRLVRAVAALARSDRFADFCAAPVMRESSPCAAVPVVVP